MAISRTMIRDHDQRGAKFVQRSYARLYTQLLSELVSDQHPDWPSIQPLLPQIAHQFVYVALSVCAVLVLAVCCWG